MEDKAKETMDWFAKERAAYAEREAKKISDLGSALAAIAESHRRQLVKLVNFDFSDNLQNNFEVAKAVVIKCPDIQLKFDLGDRGPELGVYRNFAKAIEEAAEFCATGELISSNDHTYYVKVALSYPGYGKDYDLISRKQKGAIFKEVCEAKAKEATPNATLARNFSRYTVLPRGIEIVKDTFFKTYDAIKAMAK
ncbi:MAG: hypothetical protein FWE53_01450 [Firmicutes bacterium]|nr:hypothetical protein [Bacillota bacterium]